MLNAVLTEMDTSGQKLKTKVFAGGAVIAEQEALGGSAVWTHADPVTGSFQRVFKSGAAIDSIRDRQEFEPLGQSVRTTAPPVFDPPPPNPAPVINDSLFPEWQCQLPKQLMPSHCGLKMLADEKAYFGKWGEDKEKGNVSKLSDSPLPERYSGGVDRMTYALAKATAKPNKKKDDDDIYGNASGVSVVNIQIGLIDMTDTGAVDASQSGINSDDDWIPKGCKNALQRVGKTIDGFKRAVAALPRIEELTSKATGNILAAIGIVETDFLNRKQLLGGAGRGVYQIDLDQNRNVTEAQAMDFDFATKWVSKAIQTNLNDIHTAMGDRINSSNFNMLLAGAVRTHNAGRGGVVVKPNLGKGRTGPPQIGSILQNALNKNDMRILDKGTAGGNDDYVTNVMDVYSNCFGR